MNQLILIVGKKETRLPDEDEGPDMLCMALCSRASLQRQIALSSTP